MKKAWIALLLILSFGFLGTMRADIQPVHGGFYQKAIHATFALYAQRSVTKPKIMIVKHFICTATAIEKTKRGYLLLSAGHCIADTPSDVTYAVAEEVNGPLMAVSNVTARENESEDISLFYFHTLTKYPVIQLGDESVNRIGDAVVNPNFTGGLVKQLSFGRIASVGLGAGTDCDSCIGEFLVDNFAGPGASGSAMISLRSHKIIGIDITATPGGTGVEPASIIKKALTEASEYSTLHVKDEDDNQ